MILLLLLLSCAPLPAPWAAPDICPMPHREPPPPPAPEPPPWEV